MKKKKFLTGYIQKDDTQENGVLSVAIATDGSIDRDGERIDPKGWDFDNFNKNPVLMWAHDYRQEPIGKVTNIRKERGKILFTPKFAVDVSERAKQIFDLYKGGYLNAFSVGFIPKEWKDNDDGNGKRIRTFTETELLEISAVPVPSNARALVLAREAKNFDDDLLKDMEDAEDDIEKSAVPFKDRGIVEDTGTAWSGPKEVSATDDVKTLKKMSTWYDREDADVKSSYKLPHHRSDDLKAVFRGVASAMAALLGARGGVDIPDGDRRGVYNHLAKHYRQFDKEPPEFKDVEAQILKDVDFETDAVIVVNIIKADQDEIKKIQQDIDNINNTLVNKDKESTKKEVDELISGADFNRAVLRAVDKAIGKSLRGLNQNAK